MACMDKIVIYVIALMFVILVFSGVTRAETVTVHRAQAILKKMNYYPDAVTGSMNPATIKAIVTFQTDYNLKPNGRLDDPTCRALVAEDLKITTAADQARELKTVTGAQTSLKSLFYYFGPVSGKRGDIPKSSLSDFQKDNNIPVSGNLDEKTVSFLESGKAQPRKPVDISAHPVKPEPTPPETAEKKETAENGKPKTAEAKPAVTPENPEIKKPANVQPQWNVSMGQMSYKPRSGYDSTSYEALNETLNPGQAVIYDDESFAMIRLALDYAPFKASLSTSRLGGGENAADTLDFSWYVSLKKKPCILSFQVDSVESDALVDGQVKSIATRSVSGEWLYRYRPWMALGVGVSHGSWPTLVSCKSSASRDRDIRFDEDFTLSSLNAVIRFDSMASDRRPLFKIEHLYPYVAGSFTAGLGFGTVSGSVMDRMSSDLDHAFSPDIPTVHVKFAPEAGLTYQIHRPGFDLALTLGYALTYHVPNLALHRIPGFETDDEVEFYRRNVSHGPVLGGNVSF